MTCSTRSRVSPLSNGERLMTRLTVFLETPATRATSLMVGRLVFCIGGRSEEHTSELQSLMRISYAVFCLKKKKKTNVTITTVHVKDINSSKTSLTGSCNTKT